MENKFNQVIETLADIKKSITALEEKVENVEKRLNGLGKVDSIEHRVTSNQIDITDIKEALERMEQLQNEKIEVMLKRVVENLDKRNTKEFNVLHKRLDSHLLKLGKVEEEILMIKED